MASEPLRRSVTAATIDVIGDDLLHNIMARLPATSFASAACVSRSWNTVCDRVLSRPKLSSACSFNHSLQDAVKEVVDKVLSEPIRPHFAIASIGGYYDDDASGESHRLITQALGSQVPVITNRPSGIVGRDALSGEFKEIDWNFSRQEIDVILLIVGFLPGLKVKIIPLLNQIQEPKTVMIDEFVTDIREFSTSISGCNSPAAIIMFGNYFARIEDVIEKLGIGEPQFHAVLSSRLSPVGPTYKATSVIRTFEYLTEIAARREGSHENIDGEAILNQVYDELEDRTHVHDLVIGVTKKRKYSIGQEKVGCMTSLAFHEISRSSEEMYIYVLGNGLKISDTFHFYTPDSTTALSSAAAVSSHLRSFNQGSNSTTGGDKLEVFGGLVFMCPDISGEPYNYGSYVNCLPFLNNFPGVAFGGTFCSSVIGRHVLTPYVKESQEQSLVQCCVHIHCSVYLIMSYTASSQLIK